MTVRVITLWSNQAPLMWMKEITGLVVVQSTRIPKVGNLLIGTWPGLNQHGPEAPWLLTSSSAPAPEIQDLFQAQGRPSTLPRAFGSRLRPGLKGCFLLRTCLVIGDLELNLALGQFGFGWLCCVGSFCCLEPKVSSLETWNPNRKGIEIYRTYCPPSGWTCKYSNTKTGVRAIKELKSIYAGIRCPFLVPTFGILNTGGIQGLRVCGALLPIFGRQIFKNSTFTVHLWLQCLKSTGPRGPFFGFKLNFKIGIQNIHELKATMATGKHSLVIFTGWKNSWLQLGNLGLKFLSLEFGTQTWTVSPADLNFHLEVLTSHLEIKKTDPAWIPNFNSKIRHCNLESQIQAWGFHISIWKAKFNIINSRSQFNLSNLKIRKCQLGKSNSNLQARHRHGNLTQQSTAKQIFLRQDGFQSRAQKNCQIHCPKKIRKDLLKETLPSRWPNFVLFCFRLGSQAVGRRLLDPNRHAHPSQQKG